MNHENGRNLSMVAFWGGHKSTPVKYKHMLFPPACSALINEDLPGSWQCLYMKLDSPLQHRVCTVPQFARYDKLPPPCGLRPASSQASPGYMAYWVKSLCILVSGWDDNTMDSDLPKYSM
jgi:hypothetical protein